MTIEFFFSVVQPIFEWMNIEAIVNFCGKDFNYNFYCNLIITFYYHIITV